MVLEFVRRLTGARERPRPEEQLILSSLAQNPVVLQDSGGVPFDLYTLLEDEKIGRELWGLILAFASRDMKLSFFDERDEEYLFWKIESLATRIGMAINAMTPHPDRYPKLEDYVKTVESSQLLVENLKLWMLAVARRSRFGFERRLQATRHIVMSYGMQR